MMFYAVDAIERETARLVDDDETALTIPLARLPQGAAEGDVLKWHDGAWQIDTEETQRRRDHAASLLRELLGG